MMKKLLMITLPVLAASTVVAGDIYDTLDADQSGAISKTEGAALPGLAEQWQTLDVDANGELTVAEFAEFKAPEVPKRITDTININ